MANGPQLTATIKADGFTIGPNPQTPNEITVSITNGGDRLPRTRTSALYLRGTFGAGVEPLFLDDTDARLCVADFPDSSGWKFTPDFSDKDSGKFALKFTTTNATFFEKGQTLTIVLSSVISKTAEGAAVLWFDTGVADGQQKLPIQKLGDTPDIISFYAVPTDGARTLPLAPEALHLPSASLTLKWLTFKLVDRRLMRDGSTDPIPCDFRPDAGSKIISVGNADQAYSLSGWDGKRTLTRTLSLRVLSTGWWDLTNTVNPGDPGYPVQADEADAPTQSLDLEPTLVLNANDQRLYGIFRHPQRREQAMLFRADQPFLGWQFVPSSVPSEAGRIPKGFATSPGVFLDQKIWLIGGSQIDPDNTSNAIWRFDPQVGVWESRGTADWTRRMGHAVIVYNQQIWVLGGRDEAGNALNEVWSLDITSDNRKWTRQPNAPWGPRCLLSPAVFGNQIWIYGGVKEPFSDGLYADLYAFDGSTWSRRDITKIIDDTTGGKPIASALQVAKGRQYLFGAFRTVNQVDKSEVVQQFVFSLSGTTTGTWTSVTQDNLQDWGDVTTFRYQVVNFKDRMLIARALSYDSAIPTLKVYVLPS